MSGIPHVNQILTLDVHGLGSGGEGVGHSNGYAIFVEGALPRERATVQMIRCHKRYGWAKLLSLASPSSDRVRPPCPLFGACGGCQLMHLSYPKQLETKRQRIIDALQRIGGLDASTVLPCLPAPSPLAYRNKIQLPVRKQAGGTVLGLYARSSHTLVELDACLIHCPLGERIYQNIRTLIKDSGVEPYDPASGAGELRHVLIKSAVHTQEALVVLIANDAPSPLLRKLAARLIASDCAIKGVVHNKHQGRNNIILGDTYTTLEGSGYIQERLCGLTFHVSPASFFQINPTQAERLYAIALAFASPSHRDTLLDAYCGVGTLSLIAARHAGSVIGVECVPAAVRDAQHNAALNDIHNAQFVCAPSETFIASLSAADVAFLNPPRAGCAPSLLEALGRLAPRTLVYISCDPATLARDLARLTSHGYRLDALQPCDMFPQTAHIECIAKLTRTFRNACEHCS
jgi:23S rRNA (uracil1939-C5)-methyltransferase